MASAASSSPKHHELAAADIVRAPIEWLARSPRWSFVIIFVLSSAVQGFMLTKVSQRHIRPHTRWEVQAVAVSLAEHGTFADPYALPTGPTAHLPPLVPGQLALIYRLFGLTLTAGYIAWLLRIAIFAAMDAMLPWVAGRLGIGRPAGVIAGLGKSLIVTWPGHGEAPTAILLAVLLVVFVRRWTVARDQFTVFGSLLIGLAWGIAFHVQPALLPVLMGCMVFELWWSRARCRWRGCVFMTLGVVLACAPWAWRNYAVFDSVFFIRSNFGLELRMGNHDGAFAAMDVIDQQVEHRHPRTHVDEARLLQEIGEIEYMGRARHEGMQWIREHPGRFSGLTAGRIIHFWFGPLHRPGTAAGVTAVLIVALLGARRIIPRQSIPQRAAMLIPLLTFPLVYYIVAYMIRYTIPVSWIPAMLAGAQVWHWFGRR